MVKLAGTPPACYFTHEFIAVRYSECCFHWLVSLCNLYRCQLHGSLLWMRTRCGWVKNREMHNYEWMFVNESDNDSGRCYGCRCSKALKCDGPITFCKRARFWQGINTLFHYLSHAQSDPISSLWGPNKATVTQKSQLKRQTLRASQVGLYVLRKSVSHLRVVLCSGQT